MRRVDGTFIFDGDQVAIEDGVEVVYESLCGACYLEESRGMLNRGRRVLAELETAYDSAPDPDFA